MYTDNMIKYIKSGLGFPPERKRFLMQAGIPLILALFVGLIPGIVMKGHWLFISVTMLLVSFVNILLIFHFSKDPLTVRKRLILQTVIFSSDIVQIFLVQCIYFTLQYDTYLWLLVLLVPILVIPLLLGLKGAKMIRKDSEYNAKAMTSSKIRFGGAIAGFIGMNFAAAFFSDVKQNTAIIIVLICFETLSCFLSFGLLSIQRLYYLSQLKKLGIQDIDEMN